MYIFLNYIHTHTHTHIFFFQTQNFNANKTERRKHRQNSKIIFACFTNGNIEYLIRNISSKVKIHSDNLSSLNILIRFNHPCHS